MELSQANLEELASHHQNIKNLLSCPICLDIFVSPSRTKCDHVFCKTCIEDHIRKGKKKILCPLCNTPGLNKRGLELDTTMSQLVDLMKKLIEAEQEDTNGEIDFMNVRVRRVGSRESNGSPFKPGESKWTPVKEKLPKGGKEVWHKNKRGRAKTYSRARKDRFPDEGSPVYPGERVEGDQDTVILQDEDILLPLADKQDLVQHWLKDENRMSGEFVDLSSQPADFRGESTPQPSTSGGTMPSPDTPNITPLYKPRKFFKTRGVTPALPIRLLKSVPTPPSTSAGRGRGAPPLTGRGRGSGRGRGKKKSSSPANLPSYSFDISQDLPTISQAVDVNNTFDKLFTDKITTKPPQQNQKSAAAGQAKHKSELFWSQSQVSDLDSSLELLAPGTTDTLIQSLNSPNILAPTGLNEDERRKKYAGKTLTEMLEEGLKAEKEEREKKKRVSWQDNPKEVENKNAEDKVEEVTVVPETPLDKPSKLPLSKTNPISESSESLQKPGHNSNLETESFPSIISGSQEETTHSRISANRSLRKSFLLDVDTQELKENAEPMDTLELIQELSNSENKDKRLDGSAVKNSRLSRRKHRTDDVCSTPGKSSVFEKEFKSPMPEKVIESPRKSSRSMDKRENLATSNSPEKSTISKRPDEKAKSLSPVNTVNVEANSISPLKSNIDERKTSLSRGKSFQLDNEKSESSKLNENEKSPEKLNQEDETTNVSTTKTGSKIHESPSNRSSIRNKATTTPSKSPRTTLSPRSIKVSTRLSQRASSAISQSLKSSTPRSKHRFLKKSPKRLNKKGRVKFNLLGRIKLSPRKSTREKVCSYLQLGLLASNIPVAPSLRALVQKKREHLGHVEINPQQKVESWLTRLETGSVLDTVEDQPVVKTREILGKSVEHRLSQIFGKRTEEERSVGAEGVGPNLLQRHLSTIDDEKLVTKIKPVDGQHDAEPCKEISPLPSIHGSLTPSLENLENLTQLQMELELDLVNRGLITPNPILDKAGRTEAELPMLENEDSNELPDPEKHTSFMAEVLGEKMCSLYSQDRETRSQEINRIALQEFRSENDVIEPLNPSGSSSIGGIASSNSSIGGRPQTKRQICSSSSEPMRSVKRRRINVIESESEESNDAQILEIQSQHTPKVVEKPPKAGGTGSRTKFENTFKNLNESLDIEDSQDSTSKESRSVRKTGRRNRTRTPLVEVLNTNTGSQQDKRTSGNKLDRKQESRIPKNKFERESRTPQSKFDQESRIVQSRRDQKSINNLSDIEENAVFQSELEFEPLIPPAETNTQSISLLSDPSGKKKRSLKANPGETERSAASEGSETENDNTQELQAALKGAVGTLKSMKENFHQSLQVLGSPNQTVKEGTPGSMMIQIETDQVDSVDDTPAAVADLDADAPGVSEDDDDMFSATPDEPSRLPLKFMREPGLTMVEEEELEPGRNTFEVGETEEISSAPVDSNDPGIEVPDTEDILGEEFMQEVLKAEFKDGEDVEKSSSNDLSQVSSKKKSPEKLVYQADTSSWNFVLSNISQQDRPTVNKFLSLYSMNPVSGSVDKRTTHIIVNTDEDLLAQRTLKYLQGVCRGLTIVSHLWCENSVDEGRLLDPLHFEVLDAELKGANGPYRSRMSRIERRPPVLQGWEVMVLGEIDTIPLPALIELITLLGARYVEDVKNFSYNRNNPRICVVDSIVEIEEKQARRCIKARHTLMVDKEWLLETIGGWEIRPVLAHASFGILAADIEGLGYPANLIGEPSNSGYL